MPVSSKSRAARARVCTPKTCARGSCTLAAMEVLRAVFGGIGNVFRYVRWKKEGDVAGSTSQLRAHRQET